MPSVNYKFHVIQLILMTTAKMRKRSAITGKDKDSAKNCMQDTCTSIARNHADCVKLTRRFYKKLRIYNLCQYFLKHEQYR